MILTRFELITTLLGGIFTCLMMLAAGVRWIYRQGVSSQNMVNALQQNTKANDKLTVAFDVYSQKVDGTLSDLLRRVSVLESRGRPW